MSVRAFLAAGYWMIVQDFLRVPGMLLDGAVERTNEVLGIAPANPEAEDDSLNQQSLLQLEQMMMGVR